MSNEKLRVLVVDDSAFNRRSIVEILSTSPDIEVVGRAADGEEALRLIGTLDPHVITLDLEMPKMDGFTFLRILMGRSPIPVIVVSSYSQKENVFKALELGALDFVAKPDRARDPDLETLRAAILARVMLARGVRSPFQARRIIESVAKAPPAPAAAAAPKAAPAKAPAALAPQHLIAIAASTGGPSALMDVFAKLPRGYRNAVLVVQHMPENFTRTFAGSISTAVCVFYWNDRSEHHYARLTESIRVDSPAWQDYQAQLANQGITGDAAYAATARVLEGQSLTMGANDVFLILAAIVILLVPLVWLAKPPFRAVGTGGGGASRAHPVLHPPDGPPLHRALRAGAWLRPRDGGRDGRGAVRLRDVAVRLRRLAGRPRPFSLGEGSVAPIEWPRCPGLAC